MAKMHFGYPLAVLETERLRLASPPSKDYCDVINLIAFHIHFRIGDARVRATALAEEAYQVAEQLDYPEGMVMANLTRGFIAYRDNAPGEGIEAICRDAMAQAERLRNPILHAHALVLMSLWSNRHGGGGDALSYNLIAFDLLSAHPWNVIGRIAVLYQLGTTYLRLRQFDSAARYLEESCALSIQIDDPLRVITIRSRLARCWYEIERYDDAFALAEAGLDECEPLLATRIGLTVTCCDYLMLIAKVWMRRGDRNAAYAYAERAMQRLTSVEGWHEHEIFLTCHFHILALIGSLHWRSGVHSDALDYLHRAATASTDTVSRARIAEVHSTLSSIYKETGDFERALFHFEQFHHYLTLAESTRHYEQLQVVFQMSNAILVQQATDDLHKENTKLHQVVTNLHALHRRVRDAAHRDSLTQLYNRRYLDEQLPRLVEEARLSAIPLSVAMLDIDNFKGINDTYRHVTGDRVLQALAQMIRAFLQPAEAAVRYGGDEIVLLLPGVSSVAAQARIETLHRAIEGFNWASLVPGIVVTISAGVATATVADRDMSLLDRADASLLAAKRGGKNQWLMAAS